MLNARDPRGLAGETYDLAIVGGGVYGIMLALEAARRNLRPILLERQDFAGATSANSLRIVHGGLRYLQTLDLHRFFESVAERRWLLRHFPDLVHPLACLMPLHGDGVRRPSVFRAALALNDMLSWRRNAGTRADRVLPGSRVLSPEETAALVPGTALEGLRGAALWYDAFAMNAPRLVIEALHWACAHGARALNYVEARALLEADGRVAGLAAVDALTGEDLEFRAPVVVNAAGPWAPAFAASCGAPAADLMQPSLAWNLVLDRAPPSRHALAVTPRRPGAQTYFLVPWRGVLLAGTGHAPWREGPDRPEVVPSLIERMLADLNEALPGLELGPDDVARVLAGLLPAERAGTAELTVREAVVDHGARGGPAGFFSLAGIKLTTARRVADKVLGRAFPSAPPAPYAAFARPEGRPPDPEYPFDWMPPPGDNAWTVPLRQAVTAEAAVHLDDLVLRRSSLGDNPARAAALAGDAAALFDWDRERRTREVEAFRRRLGGRHKLVQS